MDEGRSHRNTPFRNVLNLSDAASRRLEAERIRAEDRLSRDLESFWCRDWGSADRVRPLDLVPLFRRYAASVFDAYAAECLNSFEDAEEYFRFLRWDLSELVVKKILPPSERHVGPSSLIRFRESIHEFVDRIGGPDEYDSQFHETQGTWECLVEDACVDAIRTGRDRFTCGEALVWALRSDQNSSELRELLAVSLGKRSRGFVARWWEQEAKLNRTKGETVAAGSREQPTAFHGKGGAASSLRPTEAKGSSGKDKQVEDRRALIDAFILNCQQETPVKVTRKMIWQAAKHKTPRQLQYWQASDPKATLEDDKNFRRILEMNPADFVKTLKNKTTV